MQYLKLFVSIALPLVLGYIAGLYTGRSVPEWYGSLQQPSFSPPNWVFGPVWTVLYVLMGISCYMVWTQEPSWQRNITLGVFLVQLLLNFAWSFIFFYWKSLGWAFVEIVVLWIAIIAMIFTMYTIKPLAAFIQIPYLLWVSFAAILNLAFYKLN